MPIQTSPGVAVVEKDLSQVVTFTPTNEAVVVIDAEKGPIEYPTLISSGSALVDVFGKPNDANAHAWYAAWNFLQYSNKLWVIRAQPTDQLNAGTLAGIDVSNVDEYENKTSVQLAAAGQWIAKNPGTIGNSLRVITLDADNWSMFTSNSTKMDPNGNHYSTYIQYGAPATTEYVENLALDNTAKEDELVVIVIDSTGAISGTPGTVLEVFETISKASDAVNYKNESIYYVDYINRNSNYIYWGSHPSTLLNTGASLVDWGSTAYDVQAEGKSFKTFNEILSSDLSGGNNGTAPDSTSVKTAYDLIKNKEIYNISFIITGAYDETVVKHCVENICEVRKDCITFISPNDSGSPYLNKTSIVTDLISYKEETLNLNSSYAVMDSGFKYQFDDFRKKWRWIPLNGDIAGLCARTDSEAEPWFSPAGYNRGQIKGVTKLSSNLDQAARDILYPKGINAVVSFRGQGTILYGDKTLQSKASAFDRINVRRLFIILEKAIADAAKYQLFELNDEFTRAQFKSLVEPFLRIVKGRRGIQDFKVVCDTSNNTEDVVSMNQFIADIYILPLYSINYITLNFIAVKSTAQFSVKA